MDYEGLPAEHATSDGREKWQTIVLTSLFALVSLLAGVDLLTDLGEGASTFHLVIEGALLVVGLVGLAGMARVLIRLSARAKNLETEKRTLSDRLRSRAEESHSLRDQLLKTATEADRWRTEARELVRGLAIAIDRQFDDWSLTDAEKEVALLLLKGLSHKEIAAIRDTSDATTRQQAGAVYKKAGLSGRNDLAAFFLEDLLDRNANDEGTPRGYWI